MRLRRPPHIYRDETWYMVTASTYRRAPHLADPARRDTLRDTLQALLPEHGITLRAWVILADHYHMLLRTSDGGLLPRLMNRLHGSTSTSITR